MESKAGLLSAVLYHMRLCTRSDWIVGVPPTIPGLRRGCYSSPRRYAESCALSRLSGGKRAKRGSSDPTFSYSWDVFTYIWYRPLSRQRYVAGGWSKCSGYRRARELQSLCERYSGGRHQAMSISSVHVPEFTCPWLRPYSNHVMPMAFHYEGPCGCWDFHR